ncbi:GNAT family N-acetyltransferase [Variovorax sp. LG9.2]|uniref:GNAT family N-acetyltransferase n=1 Tax=Variovorax sp. LG9.2 TaxID=3048626 RepID=UPI002B23D4F6|nr:GNAT family N-acetyltransferase [Variovorax sp. LG9.2]MEB0056584.1 GNAT family N-acetyltransferase [Variovorax sp. LG9.2]
MPELHVRQLTSSDAEAFSSLRRIITADDPLPMGLTLAEEMTRPMQGFRDQLGFPAPNAAFGAFVEGELRGCAAISWTSKFASSMHKVVLWGTFVHPAHRGKGLGRSVVSTALDHARSHDVHRVNLTVFVPNIAATSLYQSLGFKPYGIEPDAVCIGSVFYDGQHMSLRLTTA